MQVRKRSSGVVRFLGVDVKERRLKEAPEEGGGTQNCTECLHKLHPNLPSSLGFVACPLGVITVGAAVIPGA